MCYVCLKLEKDNALLSPQIVFYILADKHTFKYYVNGEIYEKSVL